MEPTRVPRWRWGVLAASLMMVTAGTALGQEEPALLQPVVALLSSQQGEDLETQLLRLPAETALVSDPALDFEHLTGNQPRFTPGYADIRMASAYQLEEGAAEVFDSTNDSELWPPTGARIIAVGGQEPYTTYTGNLPRDGSQYRDGALLFVIELAEAPPSPFEGFCDYTVWAHDPASPQAFESLPEFPLDPAQGTNRAFGLRLTPVDGGIPRTFALSLTDAGFAPSETDVRALVVGSSVGITAPLGALSTISMVNYHASCSSEGDAADPATSGADQTGLSPLQTPDTGVVVIRHVPVTTTSTTSTTTPATAPTPVTTAAVATAAEASEPGPWYLVAASALILLAAGSLFLFRRRHPLERAVRRWQRAEASLDHAEGKAEPLVAACLQQRALVEDLERDREDLCRVWPPACLDTGEDGPSSEGLSSRDIHLRRMALGELWEDYKAGKIDQSEVESRWRQVNTPQFRQRMRDADEAYAATLSQLQDELTEARAQADTACSQADAAVQRVEGARAAVISARDTYAARSGGDAPPWSLLAEPCDSAGYMDLPTGPPRRLWVNIGFEVTVGRYRGSQANLELGGRMVLELENLLHDLNLAAGVDRVRSPVTAGGWADRQFQEGTYWLTGQEVQTEDTILATGAAEPGDADPSVLSELPNSIGEHATHRVSGWIDDHETLSVQRRNFHQMITARPFHRWRCVEGVWVCEEKIWRVEVGPVAKTSGAVRWFTADSAGRVMQFETEINRMAWVATSTVTRDLRHLTRWETDLRPGACED